VSLVQYPWDIVEMPTKIDAFGSVTSAEVGKEIPFHVRHMHWLHDVALLPSADGGYASFHTNQLMIPLVGGCEVRLSDGVTNRSVVLESQPWRGKALALWCKPGSWRELVTPDAGSVILVLSDRREEDAQYVRDWGTYLEGVGKSRG